MFDVNKAEKFGLMRAVLKGLLLFVLAIGVILSVILIDFFVVAIITKITGAGLLGICGPYGPEPAIWLQVVVALCGIPTGIWLAVIAVRKVSS